MLLTLLGVSLFLVYALDHCPKRGRWHLITALIWTGVLIGATYQLWEHPGANSLTVHLVSLAAGLLWIPSWQEFYRRHKIHTVGQEPVPSRTRLLTQTLWGPLALWGAVLAINATGQRVFEFAVARNDLGTAAFLKSCSVATVDSERLQDAFRDAIAKKDTDAIATYLSIGTPTFLYNADGEDENFKDVGYLAMMQDDNKVLEAVLDRGVSPNRSIAGVPGNTLLHLAIGRGNVDQVRILLRYGAKARMRDKDSYTPLEAAKRRGNPQIVALITEAMQAKNL